MSLTQTQYLDHICSKVAQQDANSRAVCALYLDNNYKMIWDKRNWKDAKQFITGLTLPTTGIMPFPANVDRIIAIRSTGNHMLSPTDTEQLIERDPTIFERIGDPWQFEEYQVVTPPSPVSPSGIAGSVVQRFIRVFPTPQATTPAIMQVKLAFTSLVNSNDSPVLRNIDEALIAYTQADMLQRQRNYQKAQLVKQNADAALEEMIENETERGAFQVRVYPIIENYEWDYYADGTVFDLFSGIPQTASSMEQQGITPLINGQSTIAVQFPVQMPDTTWRLDEAIVLNTIDPNPNQIFVTMILVKSVTGFTAQLNATPTTSNYTLSWTVKPLGT